MRATSEAQGEGAMSSETNGATDAAGMTDELNRLPLTRLHLFILVACAVGFSFDLAEIAFGGVLSAIFSAPPNPVDPLLLAWLLAAVYVGAIGGAPLLGWLADRVGRQPVMLGALAILALTSIGAALSPTIPALIVFRGLSGFALGAYPPLMIAFLTDILPPARRGSAVFAAVAVGYLGPPAIIFFVRGLGTATPLGLEAWRWAFLIAGAGAAICTLLFLRVPESARWLISKGRLGEARRSIDRFKASATVAETAPVAAPETAESSGTMTNADFIRRTVFLVIAYFLTPWATSGFTVLSGAVLVQKGINPQDSILYVGVSTFGPLIGTLLAGAIVDRLERRMALAVLAGLLMVTGLVFGVVTDPVSLMASGLVFNLLVNLLTPVLVLYAAELFTTERRAQGTSWGWASTRVGAALVPLALLPLLRAQGPLAMFVVIAGTLIAFIAVIVAFGPRGRAGRSIA
jgi:putative MFS transporter